MLRGWLIGHTGREVEESTLGYLGNEVHSCALPTTQCPVDSFNFLEPAKNQPVAV